MAIACKKNCSNCVLWQPLEDDDLKNKISESKQKEDKSWGRCGNTQVTETLLMTTNRNQIFSNEDLDVIRLGVIRNGIGLNTSTIELLCTSNCYGVQCPYYVPCT